MKQLKAEDFITINENMTPIPLRVDLVYTCADHPRNVFQTAIYKPDAKLWMHKDLAAVTLRAAEICYQESGYIFEIKDSLRPVEAQTAMIETPIVQKNPHWIGPLLARPGVGGHPRGMAVDIVLRTASGNLVDMGTEFDHFDEDPAKNPADRSFTDLAETVLENRRLLQESMCRAGDELGHEIWPLPTEWWDFRFPRHTTDAYAPLSDRDLPAEMRLVF